MTKSIWLDVQLPIFWIVGYEYDPARQYRIRGWGLRKRIQEPMGLDQSKAAMDLRGHSPFTVHSDRWWLKTNHQQLFHISPLSQKSIKQELLGKFKRKTGWFSTNPWIHNGGRNSSIIDPTEVGGFPTEESHQLWHGKTCFAIECYAEARAFGFTRRTCPVLRSSEIKRSSSLWIVGK